MENMAVFDDTALAKKTKNCSDGDYDGTVSERPMWPINVAVWVREGFGRFWPD